METKKNQKFDLESKRSTFFLLGLTISLAMVLLAFKSGKEVTSVRVLESDGDFVVPPDIYIPNTKEIEEVNRVPPPVLKLFDEIKIVDNSEVLPEADFIFDEPDDPMPLPVKTEEAPDVEPPLSFAEQMPEFPGGAASLNRWLSRNINYPDEALKLGLSGRVYLNFIVDKDGSISDINVIKGIDKLLDQEAIRVIAEMPNWKPGMQNGVPVRVSYTIYISFKMN